MLVGIWTTPFAYLLPYIVNSDMKDMKNILTSIELWFNQKFGWFFTNGMKVD